MSKKADELAALFEIDSDASLDTGSSDYDVSVDPKMIDQSFEERCKDAKAPMVEAPVPETYSAKKEEKKVDCDPEPEIESPSESPAEVHSSPPAVNDETEVEPVTEPVVKNEKDTDDEEENEDDDETETGIEEQEIPGDVSHDHPSLNDNNPLGLVEPELKIYKLIRERYPRFVLHCNNPLFKNFYVYKFRVLKTLLSRFPVLNLKSHRKELMSTKIDHFMGNDTPHPDIFREKLDDCFRTRIRLSELLSDALEQKSSWIRQLELLQGKLYKDFDLKGAHKRDGLNAEHIADIEDYVAELKGFIARAEYIEGLLVAAAESLSRQLTCLQMRQPSSGKTELDYRMPHEKKEKMKPKDDPILGLDGIDEGELITTPPPSDSAVSVVNMGEFDSEDELMNVGFKKKETRNG